VGTVVTLPYTRREAKEWATATWHGCCNVVMPTFTHDARRLNARAIAHDVRLSAAFGFWGTLLVSECGTTLEEYCQMIDIAAGAKPRDFHLVVHGSFDTLDDVIAACRYGQAYGCSAVLLSYPPFFYPRTAREIYDYTRAVAEATDLALILFAVPAWNFARFHPSQFPLDVLAEMCDLETVVAVKYECGQPGFSGVVHVHRLLRDRRVLLSDPMEYNGPACIELFGMQWMGTSGYEYFADRVPRWFRLLRQGHFDEGMELFWSLQPARMARATLHASVAGAKLIHRMAWKYMGWLNGMAGGPLRMPTMRLDDAQMRALRQGLERSGIPPTTDPDSAFFVGRFPE
jgi:4-hydroxy-tetrahydrodipicolinate synthase